MVGAGLFLGLVESCLSLLRGVDCGVRRRGVADLACHQSFPVFREWFEDLIVYVVIVDGAGMAHAVPDGTVWAGEVWWWMFTRTTGKG